MRHSSQRRVSKVSGAAVEEAFERPWKKVALEAIGPSGKGGAWRIPPMRRERGPPGHLGGNVMGPATFSITLLDENQIILYLGMSPAELQPACACTRIT